MDQKDMMEHVAALSPLKGQFTLKCFGVTCLCSNIMELDGTHHHACGAESANTIKTQ